MRGLPKAVIDFGKEGLYYKNVITSAPSTLQSISSMMTSSPSYLMSRSYNNFRGKFSCFDYFPDMLRNVGYDVIGAIYFKHGREVMSNLLGLVDRKFYPKGLSHRKSVWTNEDIYNLFGEILKKHDWNKPTMTYLHFNVRVDDNVSEILNDVIEDLKEKGLYNKSVILMNSDHGYPDADKGYNFEAGLKEGWGHDKYLTNDNILTPLVIRHPKVEPKVIEQAISTIDIVPTLCSLMDIGISPKFHGLDLMNGELDLSQRLVRTDNRYVGQVPSYHAYTKGNKKAIVFRQKDKEDEISFFDLSIDQLEQNPESNKQKFKSFYEEVVADERKLNHFHQILLEDKWKLRLRKEITAKPLQIALILPSTEAFQKIALAALKNVFTQSDIHLYQGGAVKEGSFDLKIFVIESEIPWELKKLKKYGNLISAKEEIYLDNNGERLSKPVTLNLYRLFLQKRWTVIKHDPRAILDLSGRVFRRRTLSPIR